MNYIEEKTPAGYTIKIMTSSWQYMIFDRKGNSVYMNSEAKKYVQSLPLLIFVGSGFRIKQDHTRDYHMLKVRKGVMVLPYGIASERATRYIFIKTDMVLDAVPVRIMSMPNVAVMMREVDAKVTPDHVIVDSGANENDVFIIRNRYKVQSVIYAGRDDETAEPADAGETERERIVNLNMMSSNPVFLSRIHLKSMDLSKINQLLLDFDLSALDTECILHFINENLQREEDEAVKANRAMLQDLAGYFQFYLHLLLRSDDRIREMINEQTDVRKLAPFRTLISKVKSIYPNREEQMLYTEYENIVHERREELMTPSAASSG
jgi:hypothetical protein